MSVGYNPFVSRVVFFIYLLELIFSSFAWAAWDTSLEGSYRSFPLGGVAEWGLGYGQRVWGSDRGPFYGYVRVGAVVEGVENYEAHAVSAEIFPLSFFGVKLGRRWVQNHNDYEDYDCVVYVCRGRFLEDFVEVPLYLSVGSILGVAVYRESGWVSDGGNDLGGKTDFIEPTSGLPLVALPRVESGSRIIRWRGGIFWQFPNGFRVGYTESTYRNREALSFMWLGVVQYRPTEHWSFTLSSGEYRSNLKLVDPTIYVSASYEPLLKLGY